MKIIYDSFSEVVENFISGDSIPHKISEHSADQCYAWMQGAKEFAEWLDRRGFKITGE